MTLRLVPFEPRHFERLARWFSNPRDVVQWAGPGVDFPITADALRAMLDETRTDPPDRACWMAQIDDNVIGHVQLGYDWRNGNAVLSRVAIAPEARGRGLAQRMAGLAVDAAFADPAIARVELNVYTWNTAAIRTYETLGFVHEGVRRASALVGAERWDTAIMGMLRAEWRGAPQT